MKWVGNVHECKVWANEAMASRQQHIGRWCTISATIWHDTWQCMQRGEKKRHKWINGYGPYLVLNGRFSNKKEPTFLPMSINWGIRK
jgi:hypothetical protein